MRDRAAWWAGFAALLVGLVEGCSADRPQAIGTCSLSTDCPTGQSCVAGECQTPAATPADCVPATCEAQDALCGLVGDGCGNLLDCQGCPSGETCGGPNAPNVCIACEATSCEDLQAECGFVTDSCDPNGLIACGDCAADESCGGEQPNRCSTTPCEPKTCAELEVHCGETSDGCGGMLNCGGCPAGESCAWGGVAGRCGGPHGRAWCATTGARFGVGDFNGDGFDDHFCHHARAGWNIVSRGNGAFRDPTKWTETWCSSSTATFGVGDFNGDGLDDHFCHSTSGSSVIFSNGDGTFGNPTKWTDTWCSSTTATFGVGDFNGDGLDDHFCRTASGAWVIFSNGDGTFINPTKWTDTWCSPPSTFGVGDFNGDGADDHFCHSTSGTNSVIFSNGDGTFRDPTRWADSWCSSATATFGVGDFNGDDLDDHFCRSTSGANWVIFSNGDGTFRDPTKWAESWCSSTTATFGVGDFNGDDLDDHFCHSISGANWVIFSNGDGTFRNPTKWSEG